MDVRPKKPKSTDTGMGLKYSIVESNSEKILGFLLLIIILSGTTHAISSGISSDTAETYTLPPSATIALPQSILHDGAYINGSSGELYAAQPSNGYSSVNWTEGLRYIKPEVSYKYTFDKGSSFTINNEAERTLQLKIYRDQKSIVSKEIASKTYTFQVTELALYTFSLKCTSNDLTTLVLSYRIPKYDLPATPLATGKQQVDATSKLLLHNPSTSTKTLNVVFLPRFSYPQALAIISSLLILLVGGIGYFFYKKAKKSDAKFMDNTYGTDYWQKSYDDLFNKKK